MTEIMCEAIRKKAYGVRKNRRKVLLKNNMEYEIIPVDVSKI